MLQMRIEATAAIVGFVLGLLAAIVIASRLERVIPSPLRSLSETASRISHGNDYTLRARKHATTKSGRSSTRSTAWSSRWSAATAGCRPPTTSCPGRAA